MIDKGRQPEKKMKNCGESRLAWSSILVKDGEVGGGTMRISACSFLLCSETKFCQFVRIGGREMSV